MLGCQSVLVEFELVVREGLPRPDEQRLRHIGELRRAGPVPEDLDCVLIDVGRAEKIARLVEIARPHASLSTPR